MSIFFQSNQQQEPKDLVEVTTDNESKSQDAVRKSVFEGNNDCLPSWADAISKPFL